MRKSMFFYWIENLPLSLWVSHHACLCPLAHLFFMLRRLIPLCSLKISRPTTEWMQGLHYGVRRTWLLFSFELYLWLPLAHVYEHRTPQYVWRSENSPVKLVLSSHLYAASEDQTWMSGLHYGALNAFTRRATSLDPDLVLNLGFIVFWRGWTLAYHLFPQRSSS